MKQGQASHSGMGATKVEPRPKAVNPSAVSLIGLKQGNHAMDKGKINVKHEPLYQGRGLKAPMSTCKSHPKGSQGSY